MRDRAIIVLLEEFLKEHANLSALYASQNQLLSHVTDYLKRKELGLESADEHRSALEHFKAVEETKKKEEEKQRMVEAQMIALSMLQRAGSGSAAGFSLGPSATNLASSGLMPGSAGAVPKLTRPHSMQSSSTALVLSRNNTAPKNVPVQVDGGGSHMIASGATWLKDDDDGPCTDNSSKRPFYEQPDWFSKDQELQEHNFRYVMGVGIDVPLSSVRDEVKFSQGHKHKGYSDRPGGTANHDPNAQQTGSASARARSSHDDSDEEDGSSFNMSRRKVIDEFHERDGQPNTIPASVKKWSTVTPLDYIVSNEHSADASSRKPRIKHKHTSEKTPEDAPVPSTSTP